MLTAERLVGALVLLKALDVLARGPQALDPAAWALVLGAWVAGGAGLLAGGALASHGACWAAVLLGGGGLAADYPLELRRHHLVLLLGVALAALVSRVAEERLLLWRVQLSALYGVAALSKVNESFLAGDVLASAVVDAPVWSSLLPDPPLTALVAAGALLIAVEALLAVTPWLARLRVAGAVVAALLHGPAVVLLAQEPLVALRLVVFGGTAVLLHAASAGLVPPALARSAGPPTRTPATGPRTS